MCLTDIFTMVKSYSFFAIEVLIKYEKEKTDEVPVAFHVYEC